LCTFPPPFPTYH